MDSLLHQYKGWPKNLSELGGSIVTMVQPAESLLSKDPTRSYMCAAGTNTVPVVQGIRAVSKRGSYSSHFHQERSRLWSG
jgi:hypothetical protein